MRVRATEVKERLIVQFCDRLQMLPVRWLFGIFMCYCIYEVKCVTVKHSKDVSLLNKGTAL